MANFFVLALIMLLLGLSGHGFWQRIRILFDADNVPWGLFIRVGKRCLSAMVAPFLEHSFDAARRDNLQRLHLLAVMVEKVKTILESQLVHLGKTPR